MMIWETPPCPDRHRPPVSGVLVFAVLFAAALLMALAGGAR